MKPDAADNILISILTVVGISISIAAVLGLLALTKVVFTFLGS